MKQNFRQILDTFTSAVRSGDGAQFSALFTEDGVYDDVFFGEFHGRASIAQMLVGCFHRDGEIFIWRMIDPVDNGTTGYARWLFSYDCKLPHIKGKRIFMDGVGLFKLRDGLIARYEDAVRTAELMRQLDMPPAKQAKFTAKLLDKQLANSGWTEHQT